LADIQSLNRYNKISMLLYNLKWIHIPNLERFMAEFPAEINFGRPCCCGCLFLLLVRRARTARPGTFRERVPGMLWLRPTHKGCRLPPGHSLELAHRSIRARPSIRLWRPSSGALVPDDIGGDPRRSWAGQHQRDLRWRSTIHRARLLRPARGVAELLRAWLDTME
jgi:hypothetical protein